MTRSRHALTSWERAREEHRILLTGLHVQTPQSVLGLRPIFRQLQSTNLIMSSVHLTTPPAEINGFETDSLFVPVPQERAEISNVVDHIDYPHVRKVTRDFHDSAPLSCYRERVEIKQNQANRPVEAAGSSRQEYGVRTVPEYGERIVKQLFLMEEIYVGRSREDLQTNKAIMLKREEIFLERLNLEIQ